MLNQIIIDARSISCPDCDGTGTMQCEACGKPAPGGLCGNCGPLTSSDEDAHCARCGGDGELAYLSPTVTALVEAARNVSESCGSHPDAGGYHHVPWHRMKALREAIPLAERNGPDA